jgi:hypothetical protein
VIDLTYTVQDEFLLIKLSGEYSYQAAHDVFLQAMEIIDQNSKLKIMVDSIQVMGAPNTIDFYRFATFVAKELTKSERRKNIRMALVGQPPLLDEKKFGLLVLNNLGIHSFSTFIHDSDALKWLGVEKE